MWREREGAVSSSSPQPPLPSPATVRGLCGVLWTHSTENVAVLGGFLKGFPEEVTFVLGVEGWRGVFQTKQYAKILEIVSSEQKVTPRNA